jgi:hypothetical protein
LTFIFLSLGQRIFRLAQPVQPVQVKNVVVHPASGLQIPQQQQQQYQQLSQEQPTENPLKQMSFKFVSKG